MEISNPVLRFDPKEHRYFYGDKEVPFFTKIAKDMGLIEDNKFYTSDGRNQGQTLHSWLLFLAQGNIPTNDPEPEIKGRVDAIKKFLYESRFKFVGGETPQYESVYGYATKPDLWGYLGTTPVVIEAKRGQPLPWHKLQTASQSMALGSNGFGVLQRFGLYLKDNGNYRLTEHDDFDDLKRWAAIVNAYNAKKFYAK